MPAKQTQAHAVEQAGPLAIEPGISRIVDDEARGGHQLRRGFRGEELEIRPMIATLATRSSTMRASCMHSIAVNCVYGQLAQPLIVTPVRLPISSTRCGATGSNDAISRRALP